MFTIILFFLWDIEILIECTNRRAINFLIDSQCQGIKFRYDPNVSDLVAKIAFEKSLNYYTKNPQIQLNFCRYLYAKNNLLFRFSEKSPFGHPNLYLGSLNDLNINLQLTHSELINFKELTKTDLIGNRKPQFISDKVYVCSNYEQVFLNLNSLVKNDKLSNFLNYKDFLPDYDDTVEIQNYTLNNKKKLINAINFAFENK